MAEVYTMIAVIHEPTCERDLAPCNCHMYVIRESGQKHSEVIYRILTLDDSEIADLIANDSLGG